MIHATRRKFLTTSLAAAAWLGAMVGRAWAAWPKAAFDAQQTKDVVAELYGGRPIEPSDFVQIRAPEIAENGTVVPVTVTSTLPGVESITVIAEENPRPLVSRFKLSKQVVPRVSTRMKLAKTQNITAVVEANGKLLKATRQIKVTIGGCGG